MIARRRGTQSFQSSRGRGALPEKNGELTRAVKLTGIGATAGAKAAIEAAGGSLA